MKFMHRHRRLLSLLAILLLACTSSAPVAAEYNPKTGRFMQADPHGTGLVVAPHLWYHGSNPTVTVNAAYELQFADGMNFYQFTQSNPITGIDPTGLSMMDLDWLDNVDDIVAQTMAMRLVAAEETLFFMQQAIQVAKSVAFQTAITAVVPGAGLYFAARGLAANIEDIAENGLGWGNGLMAAANIAGVGGGAIQRR